MPALTPIRARYIDLLTRLEETRTTGVSLGLERTRAVLERLGNPQRCAVTVHIAGTNGKGSTAAMTEAILRAAGLRTGLYTSPHLSRFTERIRVDGQEADGDRLAALAPRIAATGIPLTYFELATVLAFLYFAEVKDQAGAGVDVLVVETGLGGRLDATTVCDPSATAITSIALDHAELLGSTLAEIAREKAGIAKPGVPLFLAPVTAPADAAIAEIAAAVGAPLFRLGADFVLPDACAVALPGGHQRNNAAIAVALAHAAAAARGVSLASEVIVAGLRDVAWPGRMERLQWMGTDLLLDCAHNGEGAAALARALDELPDRRPRALVFSVVAGKPAAEMLERLAPRFDAVFLTRSSNPRSLPGEALRELLPSHLTLPITAIADPIGALTAARQWLSSAAPLRKAQTDDDRHHDGPADAAGDPRRNPLIVAAGSTFLVGDIRAAILGEQRDPLPTSDPISFSAPLRLP